MTSGAGRTAFPAARPVSAVAMLAAAGHMSPAAAKFWGWAVVAAIIAVLVFAFLRLLRGGK